MGVLNEEEWGTGAGDGAMGTETQEAQARSSRVVCAYFHEYKCALLTELSHKMCTRVCVCVDDSDVCMYQRV